MTCGVRNRADFHNFIDNLFKLKIKIGVIMIDSIVPAELIERKFILSAIKKLCSTAILQGFTMLKPRF